MWLQSTQTSALLLLLITHGALAFLPESASREDVTSCPAVDAQDAANSDPDAKWRVFNQLSLTETNQVLDFLVDSVGFFYLPRRESKPLPTTAGPNIVHRVELMQPVKAAVLEYLDGSGAVPDRFAKATIIRSEASPKDVMEYKIGPLPLTVGENKTVEEIGVDGDDSPVQGVIMQKLRADGEIPFYKRPVESISAGWLSPLVNREAYKLRQIFKETSGFCYGLDTTDNETIAASREECGTSLIDWLYFPAIDRNMSKRIVQVQWMFRTRNGGGDEMFLHSLPISFKIDEQDENEAEWRVFDFEYCHQGPFNTSDDLLDAYLDGDIKKCSAEDWKDFNYDSNWASTDNINNFRPGSEKASPRTFYPQGPRFQTQISDSTSAPYGFHFDYLGWEGHISMRYATGIALHDLRFRGDRIVYELALQEQFVAYSGYAGNGQTVFMDSFFGIGLASLPMRRGVDCPETARYFPMLKMLASGLLITLQDVICVFEEDGQEAEWRHTHFNGTDGPHSDSTRRSTLVIRAVATVGNYDYVYSIRFKQDASIQVDVTLAGYMLTTFYDTEGQTYRDTPFGTRVFKHSLAILHDHLSGWKVDLDILGTKNSIKRTSVKVGTWEEALENAQRNGLPSPPWHNGPYVKYIERLQLQKEFGFLIRDPGTVIHSFTNNQFTNAWGEPRGYAILHGMTTRQLLPDAHPFTKAAAWTKYHLAVTQRKENEPCSHSALYDMAAPGKPITSLDDFIDDESIEDEDLVAWVMTGLLHVPRSEDLPLISNHGSQFYIKPWNYYDRLVSLDSANTQNFDSCHPIVGNRYDYAWSLIN